MSSEYYRKINFAGLCPYLKELKGNGLLKTPRGKKWQVEISNVHPYSGQLTCDIGRRLVSTEAPVSAPYNIGQHNKVFVSCDGCLQYPEGFKNSVLIDLPLPFNPDAPKLRR